MPTTRSPEAQRKADVVRRFVDDIKNEGDPAARAEIISPAFVNHTPAARELFREGEDLFAVMRGALPDLHVTIDDQIVEGDRVVTFQTFAGTFTGTFRGRPGTGRRVSWQAMEIVTVVDDLIVDHWAVADTLTLAGALTDQAEGA